MKVTVEKNNHSIYGEYTITLSEVQRSHVKRIQELTDVLLEIVPQPEPDFDFRDITKFEFHQLEAYKQVAKMHLAAQKNKIETIKLIRSLTNVAPLKESKQLVDYAENENLKPTWWPVDPRANQL